MTLGAAEGPPARDGSRQLCLAGAAVLAIVVAVPPFYGLARRYEVVEALQFSIYAMAVPALVVLGAPGARLGLGRPGHLTALQATGAVSPQRPSWRRAWTGRSALSLGLFMAAVVAWRTPTAVDAIERHSWFLAAEVASLLAAGGAFWLELLGSGPLVSRARRPMRAVMAAVAMWSVWTVAYLVGFSSTSWYTAFHHVAGRGLSVAADQQFSTAVLWLVATLAFMPVVFWNVLAWLRAEEQPDAGAYRSMAGSQASPAGARSSASGDQ